MKTKTTLWWTCGVVHMGQTSQTDGPVDSENGVSFIHTTVEHKSGVRLGQLYCVNRINTLSIRHLKWNPKSGIWSFFIVLRLAVRPKSVLGTTCSVQLWTTVNSSLYRLMFLWMGCFWQIKSQWPFLEFFFFFFSIKSSLRSSSPANTAVNFFTVWTHEDSIITPTPSWDVVKQLGYQSLTKILLKDTCLVRFLNQQNLCFKFMNMLKVWAFALTGLIVMPFFVELFSPVLSLNEWTVYNDPQWLVFINRGIRKPQVEIWQSQLKLEATNVIISICCSSRFSP